MTENVAPPAHQGPPAGAGRGPGSFPPRFRLAGAAVHLYTATGSVLGLLIVLAAIEGEVVTALWLGLAALLVDGTDGMLARRMRVKETIPWFDGARLDDIVDYLTYVFAPVVLLWTTGSLPGGPAGWVVAVLPLLASSYQFCRVDAKTDDHTFLGWPSYWNVVAFYAIVLDVAPWTVAAFVVLFSVMVFVPIRYLYPSRSQALRTVSLALTGLWVVSYALLLLQYPDPHPVLAALSLGYIGYYLAVSGWMTARAAARRRRGGAVAAG